MKLSSMYLRKAVASKAISLYLFFQELLGTPFVFSVFWKELIILFTRTFMANNSWVWAWDYKSGECDLGYGEIINSFDHIYIQNLKRSLIDWCCNNYNDVFSSIWWFMQCTIMFTFTFTYVCCFVHLTPSSIIFFITIFFHTQHNPHKLVLFNCAQAMDITRFHC